MVLAIISAIICFIAAIIMFSQYYRKFTLLRPMAVYLIFQGVWQMASFLVLEIFPGNQIVLYVNYIGTGILLLYYILLLSMTKKKSNIHSNSRRRNSQRERDS